MTTTTVCSIFIGAVIEPAFGEWVSLPCDEEVIDEIIDNIQTALNCDEIMISDYESKFPQLRINEYADPYEVNECAERLSEYDDEQIEVLSLMVSYWGYDFDDALDAIDNGEYRIYSNCYDMSDVAQQILEDDPDFNAIPDSMQGYFDFDAYGRDLDIEGNFAKLENGDYVEVWY